MKKLTLIELLVVVAIIGILMTLLLTSLREARSASMFGVCKSNQSQIGVAFVSYNAIFIQLPYGERPHQNKSSWEVRLAPFLGVDYGSAYITSNSPNAPVSNPVLLYPEDQSTPPPSGFARSYQINAWELWYDVNLATDYGVFSRYKSRKLMELKTKTVLLVESHNAQSTYKYQGASWNSALGNNNDFNDMYSFYKN